MSIRNGRIGVAVVLALVLIAGIAVVVLRQSGVGRTHLVAYFNNSNGIFVGDEVRIVGVPVGGIDEIQPEPTRVKISFWVDDQYKIPADAKAVILSPTLVTSRAIQLTPAYTTGPVMADNTVIGQDRTAVPVEFDDFREQLQKLNEALQPTQPGGVSPLGAFVNTTADNLRGQGANIRDAIIKLSQAVSALGDHSGDLFSTLKNLSILVSALRDSSDVLSQLNRNLASVTNLVANDPNEVGNAVRELAGLAGELTGFVHDNRESLGVTADKLASVSQALNDSIPDIKEALHVVPNTLQNFINIYQPAQGTLTGALSVNNFQNPITFLCGAIQAASRMNAEQSAKLCVQYLAPIIKNRQYNFLPIGLNPIVGATARPNELTFSEDWMRPDYVPPQPPPASSPPPPPAAPGAPLPAEAPLSAAPTNPGDGLAGLMVPAGGGG
ncbi:MCE family protein [Mycolicibacterium arenosum]|uniref:MCE family protein n=1 Tax=Mycolicibacterium arenosum TaxID=2952157 RepID=A0ABT1LW83_9MYCO|nr:MCE family protein [Mycolicibacterium sp. CAU 1645]MCP9271161.1 MCE family protein [Mycolicibacterium sp. CAU 1645]